ncbi:MAG: hypothetical protein ACNA7W_19175 [Pseudomonadales bacterium]
MQKAMQVAIGAGLALLLAVSATNAGTQKPAHTRVLNFAQAPVVIDQPGHYVLNRSWRVRQGSETPLMRVRAANVFIDLRGYQLVFDGPGIVIDGSEVTVRNGRLGGSDYSLIESTGRRTIVEDIQAIAGTQGIRLQGPDSVVRNFVAENTLVVLHGPNSLLDSSRIRCRQVCAWLGDQSRVTNSQLRSSEFVTVRLHGDGNVLANNTITASFTDSEPLVVAGDDNVVLNNVFLNRESGFAAVMVIEGSGNVLRDNIAAPITNRWTRGIVFQQQGNFYGNNQMASDVPFDLEAPNQTDWGGNFGF